MKKSVFFIFLLLILSLFLGCVITPPAPDSPISNLSKWCVPEIGETATSYIGDSIIKEGIKDAVDSIIILKDHGSAVWGVNYYPAGAYEYCGEKIIKIPKEKSNDEKKKYETQYENIVIKKYRKVYISGSGQWTIYKDANNIVYLQLVENKLSNKLEKNEYKEIEQISEKGSYYEQQFIYTGSEGNILKFSYREFSDNTARPAFTVDVTYDISKDRVLRFRKCSFEVVAVNNQGITYKLLSGFKTDE